MTIAMNPPETPAPRSSFISSEAIVGIGMTVAWLGLLALMLGWAEWLRRVPAVAWIWLPLGALMMVVGGITAIYGRSAKKR